MNSQNRKKIIGYLKGKYLFALGFLSLFSLVSFIFFIYSIKSTDTDGYIINLSGKERFIAQRLALSALQFVNNSGSQLEGTSRNVFVGRIKEMKDAHSFLAHDTSSVISRYHSPEIDSIYFNSPVFLDKKINRYLNEAHLLAEAKGDELTKDNPHLQYILNSSNDLLASLNLIVYQYQKENENKISTLYYGRTAMFIGLLLCYLLVAILVFRPMTREIDRNLTNIENKEQKLQELNEVHVAAIIDAQERERQRIASDLHDGLIQTLTAISHRIEQVGSDEETLNTKSATKSLLDDAIVETRNIAHSILPPILSQFGLIPALKSLCEQIKTQSGIVVQFQTFEFSERLNKKLELSLYRIAQEALSNVIKHAEAKNVVVQLIHHLNSVVMIIEDDGKGYDLSSKSSESGMGLINIQKRVTMFKGSVAVNSSPDMGSELMIEIPLLSTDTEYEEDKDSNS